MAQRLDEGKFPLFKRDNHAYTQLDTNFDSPDHPPTYPQITLLDEMHEIYPNSTMTFLFRPLETWIRSVRNWNGMWTRFAGFVMPGLQLTRVQMQQNRKIRAWHRQNDEFRARNQRPRPIELTSLQGARWWYGHVLHIREYVREYPSHALIELDLYDSASSAELLHDLFEADADAHYEADPNAVLDKTAQCWGHSNLNERLKNGPDTLLQEFFNDTSRDETTTKNNNTRRLLRMAL